MTTTMNYDKVSLFCEFVPATLDAYADDEPLALYEELRGWFGEARFDVMTEIADPTPDSRAIAHDGRGNDQRG